MHLFVSKIIKILSEKLRNECIESSDTFCSLDIRLMTVIDGPGFKELGQFLIKVGSQHGDIDINDLMSHPSTISTNTITITILLQYITLTIEMHFLKVFTIYTK